MEQLIEKHLRYLRNLKIIFKRNLIDEIEWKENLIGITGARGVGKTTLVLQYIKEKYGKSRQCLYVSIDDINFPFKNIVELADQFVKKGGTHLFIDEIHKYPNWSIELKNIYDSYPELKVVYMGSSISDITAGNADLSRRAVVYII